MPKTQKEKIERAAEALVKKHGIVNLTKADVCEKAGVPDGSFVHYMGTSWTDYLEELRGLVEGQTFTTIKRTRAAASDRLNQVMNHAIAEAKLVGYDRLTLPMIAERCGVSRTVVFNHLGTTKQMRESVLRSAVRRGEAAIVAQGIANQDPIALRAPKPLRLEALAILKGIAKC